MVDDMWRTARDGRAPTWSIRRRPPVAWRIAWPTCALLLFLGTGVGAARAEEKSAGLSGTECLKCHADPALARAQPGQRGRTMYVDRTVLARSRHAKVACTSCHGGITRFPHDPGSGKAACAECHQQEAKAYAGSIHGRGLAKADADVPTCQRCHGGHDILAVRDPASRVQSLQQAKICMGCHADTRITERHAEMPNVLLIRAYADSVHGRAAARSGLAVAPTCTSCHGTHALTAADDPGSPVHRGNVAATCGRCHQGILAEYQGSIHAVALARGVQEAPTCTNCHGEHTIAEPTNPASKVAPRNIPKTCGTCHAAERIAGKLGLAAKRGETYADSFHGIAMKFGNSEVANCASCHGSHDVRPSSDPGSRIAKANLPATCGKCHPGAGVRFTEGRVHIEKTKDSAPGVFYVRAFYTWFIGGLMVCFLGYMVVELYGYRRRRNGSGPRMGAGR
jgi:cytochrome c7-like protein